MSSKEKSRVDSAKFSQLLCTALQIALVDLMHHWGLSPAAVVGHSSGEIGAAYALGLSEEAIQPYLERLEPTEVAVVACINSPSNITLSGDITALEKVEALLKRANVFARRLKVDNAYHSPHMAYAADVYLASLQGITILEPRENVVIFSSVTGLQVSATELDPSYWVANMTLPVQFVKALNNVFSSAPQTNQAPRNRLIDIVIEIGPHSALQRPLKQILATSRKLESTEYLSILHRGQDAVTTSLKAAANLWSHGSNLNLLHENSLTIEPPVRKVLPNLPSYPWKHSNRYWFSSFQGNSHLFATAPRLD
ncbi:hypothetical protein OIDMADRAFT_144017 [Oidiodendron maius Zn]|uniref:Malonyl-CoA:ACP transacylase (MAT) domain-containing protein n=1 Tax=Oidiodendron maius (strain Zn) TaxID=913774 RepID=A0A0C3CUV0_OIDMZ|nr:hypothetical protein OIDMADRAFT_144017 [Oidiodendron maius Zn]